MRKSKSSVATNIDEKSDEHDMNEICMIGIVLEGLYLI